jgi:hypothetical protein
MNKKYYVHALQGYQRSSYVRKGPYRYEWLAYLVAHWFIDSHPYGESVVTDSEISPELIKL